MSIPLQPLLRYWRAALLDANRHLDPGALSIHRTKVQSLASGRLDGEALAEVWREAHATMNAKEREEAKSIAILIAPQILEPRHEHSAAFSTLRRSRVPVWIPARLDREGNLLPPSYGVPMVDRAVLAPLASGVPTFSTVAAVDSFRDQHPAPAAESGWSALWEHVLALYKELFGGIPGTWVPDRHVDLGAFAAFASLPVDSTRAVRNLYDTLIDALDGNGPPPALLRNLTNGGPATDVATSAGCRLALARHLGQMGGDYPLNDGQRRALGAVLAASDGAVVAVNGPPGTGKTTLIQSVVASLWVERALAKDGEPPVILASSTNNKAITNVLDTFARAALPDDHPLAGNPLVSRWLPKLEQYGLFLPSAEQVKKGVDAKYAQAWSTTHGQPWAGLPGAMESQDYLAEAEPHWLGEFTKWSGGSAADLAEAVEALRRSLADQIDTLAAARLARTAFMEAAAQAGLTQPYGETIGRLRGDLAARQAQLGELRRHGHGALELVQGSLLDSLLSWLKPVRRRLWARTHAFLEAKGMADPAWSWDTILTAADLRAWLLARTGQLEQQIQGIAAATESWDRWRASLQLLGLKELTPDDADGLEVQADTLVRPGLFHLAARYWEGRWLLEMKEALARAKDGQKVLTGRNRAFCEQRWRRFAKLTPCLVATAFTTPRLFDFYESSQTRPFLDFIDLLIVDEAGQVPPQIGGTLFALARRAMVVGDIEQIEPVWGIEADVDDANLALHGLDEIRSNLSKAGLLAAEGSVMAAARAATAFSLAGHRGLFLDQHWRCRQSVIAYCNELAYDGDLSPMRGDSPYPLPALGHAHVLGQAIRTGTSWTNADEAAVIAAWLKRRRPLMMEHHAGDETPPSKLGDIVAVVTPFKAQIGIIRKALVNAGLGGENITVGTVHALQGAEKPVVLFSSVYDTTSAGRLFFDRSKSMLNVAVSRARESFLVFGNQILFRPDQPSLPSGLLARYLFADPANEITDIKPSTPLARGKGNDVERLDDLDSHRRTLRQAIEDARQRVLVVSPYLSFAAISADDLAPVLKRARERDIRVVVAYDKQLNTGRDGRLCKRAAQALDALAVARVETWPLDGAHNKTLAVDDAWIVEGSFNWLSALRERNHDFQRHEVSILYRGSDVSTHTSRAWREAEKLRIAAKAGAYADA